MHEEEVRETPRTCLISRSCKRNEPFVNSNGSYHFLATDPTMGNGSSSFRSVLSTKNNYLN